MSRTKKRIVLIDVDTLIVHAALAPQVSSIRAIGKNTGKVLEFSTRTAFYGHYKKKDGGWLAEFNQTRKDKGLSIITPDVFDIEDVVELVSEGNTSPEAIAKGRFKSKIEAITSQAWCKGFKICYGTGTNFRYDIAQTTPYKENRPSKPILFDAVRDYMLNKYKDHMVIRDGVESDDIITQLMWEAWQDSGENFNKLEVVASYVDKDISQTPCIRYNFDKPEDGLVQITALDAAKNLATQMLMGDFVDSIPGLPALPKEMFDLYSLRKTSGLGEKSARGVVDTAYDAKEVFTRVVAAYKGHYGEEMKPFTSFRGEVTERNWLDHLNEQFRLLRMRTDVTKDVGHVKDFLNELGVVY